MVPSRIATMAVGWGVLGLGICILTYRMVVEGVEIIDAGGEMIEVGTNVIGWEEVVEMEELSVEKLKSNFGRMWKSTQMVLKK